MKWDREPRLDGPTVPRLARTADSAVTQPRVIIETTLGEIEIAVARDRAPLSAADFLRYVDAGLYAGGGFYRAVRPDNDTGATQINVLQGGLLDLSRKLPPIAHETTDKTGLLHLNGTVSLARIAVGSGSAAAFFICVGDQPSLDFGGKRNPDGQGFAAFGQVVRGMGVVRTIWGMDASGPVPLPGMQGQILTKPAPIIRACRREQRG